jgi:AcrR family transcriptional regulator
MAGCRNHEKMKQSPVRVPFEPVEVAEATPNRRVLSKIRTRRKVLDAARALFTERGYEAATIRDIARSAGMSTGAVFANFQDKADLFEAILMEDAEKVAELMRAAAATEGSAATRLIAVLSAGYGYYLDNLPLLQATLAQSWLRPLNAELRARSASKVLLGVVGDVLREGAERGELRQGFDVRLVSELLWDTYQANYRRAIYDGWSLETLRARLTEQVELVLSGLAN